MNTTTTVEKVICSVCFRTHTLGSGLKERLGHPARHGFNIVGAHRGHGLQGAWHTGACMGWEFPHFGLSCEGTTAALKIVTAQRAATKKLIARLATRPELTYTSRSRSRTEAPRSITLRDGDAPDHTMGNSHPGYDYVHRAQSDEAAARLENETRAIAEYKKAIATWKPAASIKVAKPAPVVHLAADWKNRKTFTTARCSQFAMHPPHIGTSRLTADVAAVTCTRCRPAAK